MKKLFIAIILSSLFLAPIANAQIEPAPADYQQAYIQALRNLVALLMQQLESLQKQLLEQQSKTQAVEQRVQEIIRPSQFVAPTPTPQIEAPQVNLTGQVISGIHRKNRIEWSTKEEGKNLTADLSKDPKDKVRVLLNIKNSTDCTLSGGWTGSTDKDQWFEEVAISTSTTLTVSCTNQAGSAMDSIQVSVQ